MRNTFEYFNGDIYLEHHGIKGQKWGIKNGPPYPLEDSPNKYYRESTVSIIENTDGSKNIPVGFIFNRVGKNTSDIRTNKTGGLYVSYGQEDAARYVKIYGPDLINKITGNTREAIQHISVTKPIRLASENQTVSEMAKFLKNNPKVIESFNDQFIGSFLTKKELKFTEQNLDRMQKFPDKLESKQMAYVLSMVSVMSDFYKDEIMSLYKHFKDNGFDAIPDLHDYYDGKSKTAIIIISSDKVRVDETTLLTKDIFDSAKAYVKSVGRLPISDVYKKL